MALAPTVIDLFIGEQLTLKSRVFSKLAGSNFSTPRDLTAAKVEFRCEAFNKSTANVAGGGADQVLAFANGEIKIFITSADTVPLEVRSYSFFVWVTYPDGERHVPAFGVINVSASRTPAP